MIGVHNIRDIILRFFIVRMDKNIVEIEKSPMADPGRVTWLYTLSEAWSGVNWADLMAA